VSAWPLASFTVKDSVPSSIDQGGGKRKLGMVKDSPRLRWILQTCDEAELQFHDTKINPVVALGGLCGPTSHGRDGEPPERLAPLARSTPVPVATPKHEKAKQG
jgi:hypothetical protein